VALSPTRAFLDLGTATVAIDRGGRLIWRRPRPDDLPSPLAADPTWLVAEDLRNGTAQVSLADPATGTPRWSIHHPVTPPEPPPGGRGGQGRPGGQGGPGGNGPPPSGAPPNGPPPNGPPHDGPPRDGQPQDPACRRSEARISAGLIALRDEQDFRVVRISDGGTAWQSWSPKPVAGIELTGDLLLVAAEQLYAYTLGTGERRWQAPNREARLGVTPDGLVAADEYGLTALDRAGTKLWYTPWPAPVAAAMPHRVSVEDGVAYTTFAPRHGPLDVDVIAIALD
jgi:outer membrane protein assembly factor BamB